MASNGASNGAFHLAELAAMAGNDGGVASAAAAMARSELAAAAAVASPRSQAARSHLNTVAAQLRLSDVRARGPARICAGKIMKAPDK